MSQDDFDKRISTLRAAGERHGGPESGGEDPDVEGAMSFGLRAGAQFVSAVVIGGGAGWAIDRWLKTSPFAMLFLMVLGFIGAMVNVWLTMSKAVNAATVSAQAAERRAEAGDKVTDEIDGKSS
jgi:ATP synthase protein I